VLLLNQREKQQLFVLGLDSFHSSLTQVCICHTAGGLQNWLDQSQCCMEVALRLLFMHCVAVQQANN
jgi:hypothetical protein